MYVVDDPAIQQNDHASMTTVRPGQLNMDLFIDNKIYFYFAGCKSRYSCISIQLEQIKCIMYSSFKTVPDQPKTWNYYIFRKHMNGDDCTLLEKEANTCGLETVRHVQYKSHQQQQ